MIHEPNTVGARTSMICTCVCLAIIIIIGIVLITCNCVWPHTIRMYTVLLVAIAIAALCSTIFRACRVSRITTIYTDMCKIEYV